MILQHLKNITNSEGYLVDIKNWNEEIAVTIAKLDNILLDKMHWEIIYLVRSFYQKYNTVPTMRVLIKAIALKYGPHKGNSRYLFQLFPKNEIIRQIAKISGLPKPKNCL